MLTANGATGLNHDFYCYDGTGLVWNGTTFVAWVDANYAAYRVAATERGTSGTFTATEPDGTMRWEMRVRGASLAASYVVWAETVLIAAIKADADLGTAAGGMVANAAQVLNIGRSANPLEAGASTTETRRVVIDTREALTETRTIS